eukprot:COSAG02_NODE_14203_length_1297_cov_80.161937_1_plen_51_part_00
MVLRTSSTKYMLFEYDRIRILQLGSTTNNIQTADGHADRAPRGRNLDQEL